MLECAAILTRKFHANRAKTRTGSGPTAETPEMLPLLPSGEPHLTITNNTIPYVDFYPVDGEEKSAAAIFGPQRYRKEMTMLISEIDKNSMETIRIQTTEFKGKTYIDCRVFFTGDDGEKHPSKKGLTLAAELVDEVVAALQEAKAELEAARE